MARLGAAEAGRLALRRAVTPAYWPGAMHATARCLDRSGTASCSQAWPDDVRRDEQCAEPSPRNSARPSTGPGPTRFIPCPSSNLQQSLNASILIQRHVSSNTVYAKGPITYDHDLYQQEQQHSTLIRDSCASYRHCYLMICHLDVSRSNYWRISNISTIDLETTTSCFEEPTLATTARKCVKRSVNETCYLKVLTHRSNRKQLYHSMAPLLAVKSTSEVIN